MKKAKSISFQMLEFDEQMARAMPVARELLIRGFDSGAYLEKTVIDAVAEVSGSTTLEEDWKDATDEQATELWNRLEAAQALGIALGFMLRADSFMERRKQ